MLSRPSLGRVTIKSMLKRLYLALSGLWAAFFLLLAFLESEPDSRKMAVWFAVAPFIALLPLEMLIRFVATGHPLQPSPPAEDPGRQSNESPPASGPQRVR